MNFKAIKLKIPKRSLKCLKVNEELELIAEVEQGERENNDIAQQFGKTINPISKVK